MLNVSNYKPEIGNELSFVYRDKKGCVETWEGTVVKVGDAYFTMETSKGFRSFNHPSILRYEYIINNR